MGSRLFDEIREQRGLAYSVHSSRTLTPTCRCCSSPPASIRASARGLPADGRDRHRAARAGPDGVPRSSAHAPMPPARARSRSRTPARSPATPPTRRSCTASPSIPTRDRAARPVTRTSRRGRSRRRRRAVDRMRRPAHGGGVRIRVRASSLAGAAAIGCSDAAADRLSSSWHLGGALRAAPAGGRRKRPLSPAPASRRRPRALTPGSPRRARRTRVPPAAARRPAASCLRSDHARPAVPVRATVKRPPASVEKLYTTVAMLQRLGPARACTRRCSAPGTSVPAASGTATST